MAELVHHLRRKYPGGSDTQIAGVRDRITQLFPNGRISGYEIDSTIEYSDPLDAHVHAAAIHGCAGYIVTDDTRGFIYSDEFDYEVYTADEFLILIDDSCPTVTNQVLRRQLAYWAQKDATGFNLVGALQRAHAPMFAERIRARLCQMGSDEITSAIRAHQT